MAPPPREKLPTERPAPVQAMARAHQNVATPPAVTPSARPASQPFVANIADTILSGDLRRKVFFAQNRRHNSRAFGG